MNLDAWSVSIGIGVVTGEVSEEFLRAIIENDLMVREIQQRIESQKARS